MNTTTLAALLLATATATTDDPGVERDGPRWLKGNTHTHTLWSDGDAPPESAVAWYVDRGYHFLVLSDHNLLQTGERWFDISDDGRLTPAKVEAVSDRFGEDWTELRGQGDDRSMRLRTLDELKARLDRPDRFVLIPGEEVTSAYRMAQVHINAINLDDTLPALRGDSVQGTIQDNLDAIEAWGREKGRPVLAHLNHPNFQKSLAASNIAKMKGDAFFEVYNGHRSVENERIGRRPSTDEMWDLALVAKLVEGAGGGGMVYGLATDDAHDHYPTGTVSIPGRGWVMVRSDRVEPDAIVRAMLAGDFYASTGVTLADIRADEERLVVDLAPADGESLVTEFIGTRLVDGEPGPVGVVLSRSRANPAVYEFAGDELYVRARVASDRSHPRPYREGDVVMAWTQPVVVTPPTPSATPASP